MISQLSGTISYVDDRFVIVDTGGVGYKVFAPAETIDRIQKSPEKVCLWTHLAVREDALDLYGFLTHEELSFFELLITISGIGPKTALGILNIANIPTLKKAVVSGDPSYLTKVSGIGKRNAEKIVVELKNKLVTSAEEEREAFQDHGDSIDALKAIGYSEKEARDALKKVSSEVTDTGEKVKQALKILASGK